MRKLKLALLALAAMPTIVQSASLDLPGTAQLLAINGQEQSDKTALHNLSAGNYQIVFIYQKQLKSGSSTKLFSSKPFAMQFEVTDSNGSYSLSHKNFRRLTDAERAFNRDDMGWKLELEGTPYPAEFDRLIGSGMLPFANIEKAIKAHNKQKGIILTSAGAKDITDAVVTVDKKTGEAEITGDPVTQLKLWYTKASKEEQKAFRRWMIDQD